MENFLNKVQEDNQNVPTVKIDLDEEKIKNKMKELIGTLSEKNKDSFEQICKSNNSNITNPLVFFSIDQEDHSSLTLDKFETKLFSYEIPKDKKERETVLEQIEELCFWFPFLNKNFSK